MRTKLSFLSCCIFLLACLVTARGQSSAQPPTTGTADDPQSIAKAMQKYPPAERDVVYGTTDGGQLKLDIFAPKKHGNKPRKAIVMIHGGNWAAYDKTILSPLAQFLSHHGFVVFNINYRLVHDGKDTWPAQLDDAQRAVRWVRAHAAQYNIDPDHIGAFGHSAGGQIASLLGETRQTRENSDPALATYSSNVQAVADASGPSDFLAYRLPEGDRVITALMGGPAVDIPAKWESASPIYNVTDQTPPFLVIHGKHDTTVYYTQSELFVDRLRRSNIPVKFITTNDAHTYSTFTAKFKLAFGTVHFFREKLGN